MHLTYIVKLDVKARTMNPCTSMKLAADVSPENAANRTVCWSSSKPSVATVDSNGKACALSVGTAVIYATANDDSGAYGSCIVSVDPEPKERVTIFFHRLYSWTC